MTVGQKYRIPKNLGLVKGKIDPATCGPQGWHLFDPWQNNVKQHLNKAVVIQGFLPDPSPYHVYPEILRPVLCCKGSSLGVKPQTREVK